MMSFLQILTKDSVTVVVDAVIYAKIHDATLSVVNIEDARASTHLLGATTLRTILGTIGLSELLSDRERIDKVMQVGIHLFLFEFHFEHSLCAQNSISSTAKTVQNWKHGFRNMGIEEHFTTR